MVTRSELESNDQKASYLSFGTPHTFTIQLYLSASAALLLLLCCAGVLVLVRSTQQAAKPQKIDKIGKTRDARGGQAGVLPSREA